jgi:hypothetical protein
MIHLGTNFRVRLLVSGTSEALLVDFKRYTAFGLKLV